MSLSPGDKAPDFRTTDQDGNSVSLGALKGKKVVLYFYPKDMTPGCTAQACNLRDHYSHLKKRGYEIFGVSTDSEKLHQKFIAREKLPFSLLADTDRSLHEAYGTWVEKSMYGKKYMGTARKTFIIDERGRIEDIIEKVDTKNHSEQILGAPAAKADAPAKKTLTKGPAKKSAAKKSPAGKSAPKKKKS